MGLFAEIKLKMARDDYYVIVAKILRYLYECLKKGIEPDINSIFLKELGINRNYYDYVVESLLEYGYIHGFISEIVLGNTEVMKKVFYNLQITPDGIAYLKENSLIGKNVGFSVGIK